MEQHNHIVENFTGTSMERKTWKLESKLHPNVKALLTKSLSQTEAILTTISATDDWWWLHLILAPGASNPWQHGEIYTNIQLDAHLFLSHVFNPSSLCLFFACFHSIFISLFFVSLLTTIPVKSFYSSVANTVILWMNMPSDMLSLHIKVFVSFKFISFAGDVITNAFRSNFVAIFAIALNYLYLPGCSEGRQNAEQVVPVKNHAIKGVCLWQECKDPCLTFYLSGILKNKHCLDQSCKARKTNQNFIPFLYQSWIDHWSITCRIKKAKLQHQDNLFNLGRWLS